MSKLLGIVDVYQTDDDRLSLGVEVVTAVSLFMPPQFRVLNGEALRRRLRVHVRAKGKPSRLDARVKPAHDGSGVGPQPLTPGCDFRVAP